MGSSVLKKFLFFHHLNYFFVDRLALNGIDKIYSLEVSSVKCASIYVYFW